MTMTIKHSFNTLFIADLHLGNKRVPPTTMIDKLKKYIYPRLQEIEFLIIGGDVFDTSLSLSDRQTMEVAAFIAELLRLCDFEKVKLRVLRGTFSHDRIQGILFKTLHKQMELKSSVEYYDTISFEHDQETDTKYIYIPDNIPYESSDEVLDYIRDALYELGWESVDYIIVHGYFEHVLPPGAKPPKITFSVDQFKNMVTRLILCGHVHTTSKFKMCVYSGSFDRLCHGEEEGKGFLFIENREDKTTTVRFVENEDATRFNTVDLRNVKDTQQVISFLERHMLDLYTEDTKVYIRTIHDIPEIRGIIAELFKKKYPSVIHTHDTKLEKKVLSTETIDSLKATSNVEIPTEENIMDMMLGFMKSQFDKSLSEDRVAYLLK